MAMSELASDATTPVPHAPPPAVMDAGMAESANAEVLKAPEAKGAHLGQPDKKPPSMLTGFQIEKIGFNHSDAFQKDLRARVKAYFKDNNLSQNANGKMIAKATFWLGTSMAIYFTVIFGDLGRWPSLALWMIGGVGLACIGFNVGHDAIHGSLSKHTWINKTLAFTFDVMGASNFNWGISHCFQHHTYTNIKEADSDIETGPIMRFYPDPSQNLWFHRWQHLYAWPLYAANAINWIYLADWIQIFQVDPRTGKKRSTKDKLLYVCGKAAHYMAFIGMPLLFTPFNIIEIMIAYGLTAMTGGLVLAIVFQCAHVVEGVEWPLPDGERAIGTAWFEHQLRTTANFGGGNPLVTFFVGGLDYQVEHHLFPKICHIHYPAISKIVQETAAEYGMPYHENKTFFGALASHYRTLRRLGRVEEAEAILDEQRNAPAAA